MKIIKNLIPESKYNIKAPYHMSPKFLIIHNSYNDASAKNEILYMIRNNHQKSYHYAIDDKEIIQAIPDNRNSWNAGDGRNGNGNRNGIAIEICYSKNGGEKFDKAEKNAAKFVAYKLKQKGWGVDKVKKHQDFSRKYCPHRTLDRGWNRFLNMVRKELGQKASKTSNNKPVLVRGSKGQEVRLLQRNLRGMGYLCDVDSSFGPGTENALKRFQRAYNLSVDGSYGPASRCKLEGIVKDVQTKLKKLGYYKGNVDLSLGPATTRAVKSFQRANGIAIDGYPGKATMAKIDNEIKVSNNKPRKSNKDLYKVQVGAYKDKSNAKKLSKELKKKGYDNFIKKE